LMRMQRPGGRTAVCRYGVGHDGALGVCFWDALDAMDARWDVALFWLFVASAVVASAVE